MQYPIAEKDSEQKDSLDILEGITPSESVGVTNLPGAQAIELED